jgi:hypothetical protein
MAYFIHENGRPSGPYTIEQLQQKQMLPTTPVWTEGLSDWLTASQLAELQGVTAQAPPPFHQPDIENRPAGSLRPPKKTGSKLLGFVRLIAAAILIVIALLYLVNQFSHRHQVYGFNPLPVVDLEHVYPTNYLSAGGTYRPNFWQTQEEISGTITNRALHTNYKDIRIHVVFYSQTKTIIGSQDYIIYEYVPYGSTQAFTLKVPKPATMSTCGWEPTGATYY